MASQVVLVVKNSPTHAGDIRDMGSIPGLGRSARGGNGNPLQNPCLENPMDRGAWWATFHVVVQLLSHAQLFVTPWTAAHQAVLSFTITWNLLKLMSIESVMPSNHLVLCHPLLLFPSIVPSIRVFSNESVLRIRWPKYWSFSFSISPSNEYSLLISFRIDWLYLLSVQGNLKSLLQHHGSNASILQCSAFFMVKLSHPYMTTRKPIGSQRVRHD